MKLVPNFLTLSVLQGQRGIVVLGLQGDMSQPWMTWYMGPRAIPSLLQGPCSIPESGGLDSRALGVGEALTEKTAGPKTYCSLISQELPKPLLMWTLAGTLPLWPLPYFDHLVAQQGKQRTARWLTGKAHPGQMRKGLPEPEAFLLRVWGYRG